MTTLYRPGLLAPMTCLFAVLAAVPAQCEPIWLSGSPAGGPGGNVLAVLTLPGGDVVAGGSFRVADAAEVHNIARWDGSTWQPIGSGSDAEVTCLAQLPNGDLVAGGRFTSMGGVPCARIARYDGVAWSPVGAGFDGDVLALLALPNGELIAGGSFGTAGTTVTARIARWNGAAWTSLGNGFSAGSVEALALRGNGDVVAAGPFLDMTLTGILRWDGSTWNQVNGFDTTALATVQSLAALPNGTLAIGGTFPLGGTMQSVAIWNGSTMQPLSPPLTIVATRVFAAANGDLVAAGSAAAGSASVARWNGVSWTILNGAPPAVTSIDEHGNGDLTIGARTNVSNVTNHAAWRFDSVGWQPLGAPLPPEVYDIVRLPDDGVVVGGSFTSFAGIAANHLARFDGSGWSPLGQGVDAQVQAMAVAPDGDLIVTGRFQNAGGAPANHIARFDGTSWSTLGAGIPAAANAVAVAPDGTVAALQGSTLRLFDGLNWTSMQVPNLLGAGTLTFVDATQLAIGGLFFSGPLPIGGLTLLQNGTFTPVPGAPTAVGQVLVEGSGDLLVASASGVKRYSGGVWSTELTGSIQALTLLPNGDLLAAGSPQTPPGATTATALLRSTPGGWQSFGVIDGGVARRVVVNDRGETFTAGSFTLADGAVSYNFAASVAPCAADVQSIGAGCSGGAGPVTLTARRRAWIGGVLRTQATGMTANSLAVQALGLVPTLQPLPGGAAGCAVFVDPVRTDLLMPAGGIAVADADVPRNPALVGVVVRVQVVGVELDPVGIVRLTSTNALDCTVGAL